MRLIKPLWIKYRRWRRTRPTDKSFRENTTLEAAPAGFRDLPQRVQLQLFAITFRSSLSKPRRTIVLQHLLDQYLATQPADGPQRPMTWRRINRLVRDYRKNDTRTSKIIRRSILCALFVLTLHPSASLRAGFVYFTRSDTRIDYWQLINDPIFQSPVSDHAWPVYRDVLLQIKPNQESNGRYPDYRDRPGDEFWPQTVAHLAKHQHLFDPLHQASQKPLVGLTIGDGSHYTPDDWAALRFDIKTPPLESQPRRRLIHHRAIDDLHAMKKLAGWVAADAVHAHLEGDSERFLRDLQTLLDFAKQTYDDTSFSSIAIPLSFRAEAIRILLDDRLNQPTPLSPESLIAIAKLLEDSAEPMTIDPDRFLYETQDTIQLLYSKKGYVTRDGMVARITQDRQSSPWWREVMAALASAHPPMRPPARDELLQIIDRWRSSVRDTRHQPLHERLSHVPDPVYDDFFQLVEASTGLSYFFSFDTWPRLQRQLAQNHALHDAARINVALRRHHLDNGHWPDALADLVPAALQANQRHARRVRRGQRPR